MTEATLLESKKDLGMLVRGDILKTRTERVYLDPDKEFELAAFHRINDIGHFEFLYPMCGRDEYVVMDRVRKSIIEIKDGMIIYDRDRCATQSYTPDGAMDKDIYPKLNETLKMAGLREFDNRK